MEENRVIVIPRKVFANIDPVSGEKRKIRVAAYARVSTDADDQLNSLETQKNEFTRKILENPDWEFVELYYDEGITGTCLKRRDGFNKMVKNAKAGLIDMILVKSISRFARNTVDFLKTVRELKAIGVGVFFEKEHCSSLDDKTETMLTIFASLAQEESRQISTNVTWGIRARMKDGSYRGVSLDKYLGFKLDENGQVVIDEEEADTVRKIFLMCLSGYTYRQISKYLRDNNRKNKKGEVKWSVSSINFILSNEKYCGDMIYQKSYCKNYLTHERKKNEGELEQYLIPDHHEAIIDKDVFLYVQKLRNQRMIAYNPVIDQKNAMALAGLVYCASCGRKMSRIQYSKGKSYEHYVLTCKTSIKNSIHYQKCQIDNTVEYDLVTKAVKEIVSKEYSGVDYKLLDESINEAIAVVEISKQDNLITSEIKALENELTNLVAKQIENNTPLALYQNEYNSINDRIAELKLQRLKLNESISKTALMKNFNQELLGFLKNNAYLTPRVVGSIIKRIYRLKDNSVLLIINKKEMNLTILENIDFNDDKYMRLEPYEVTDGKKKLTYRLLYWRERE